MDLNFLTQAVIGLLVITAPPDPAKLLFFNSIIEYEGRSRTAAAMKVAFVVLLILGGAALGGAQIAGLLAKLSPSTTAMLMRVGGLLLATIGTQMLLGGLKKFFAG